MILTAKGARKKIKNGELKTIANWKISSDIMEIYLREQVKADKKTAVQRALIMPGIFGVIAVGNLFFEQDMEFLLMMLKFALFFFVLFFPLAHLGLWLTRRAMSKANDVYFGEDWFLFGKMFKRWKGVLLDFKGCRIDYGRTPKVIIISTRGNARGQIQQDDAIPIPEDQRSRVEKLLAYYNSKLK